MSIIYSQPDDAQRRREEAYLSRTRQKETADAAAWTLVSDIVTVPQPRFTTVSDKQKRTLLDLLGSTIVQALQDPYTQDVMLNDDGSLWQDRVGEDPKQIGTMFIELFRSSQHNKNRHRSQAEAVSDLLTCSSVIADGVVLNKNGSLTVDF